MSPGSDNKYLIDASNLHTGGGVQVGASVLNEVAVISSSGDLDPRMSGGLTALVSTEVAANLESGTWDSGVDVRVANSRPGNWARFPDRRYRAALTIFGPYYRPRRASREIVGFALPRLVYSLADVRLAPASWQEWFGNQIRWRRFRSADVIVTETGDAAHRLGDRIPGANVEVVPNCVSGGVSDRSHWRRSPELDSLNRDAMVFAAVGRAYPHKNLDFLPMLGVELQRALQRDVRFVVTLSEAEWEARTREFREMATNVGVISQRELGFLYESCSATMFPSLLEISSATPLESMSLGTPVFASDIESMRSAFGSAAVYFDPWDARKAAEAITPHLEPRPLADLSGRARAWAACQPTPRQRARRLLAIMVDDAAPLPP